VLQVTVHRDYLTNYSEPLNKFQYDPMGVYNLYGDSHSSIQA